MEKLAHFSKKLKVVIGGRPGLIFLFLVVMVVSAGGFWQARSIIHLRNSLSEERAALVALEQKLSLLTVSVETLIREATEETKKELEERLALERTHVSSIESRLSDETQKRKEFEERFQSETGISVGRILELEKGLREKYDLSAIIGEWRKRTAHIRCSFTAGTTTGSGVLLNFPEAGGVVYAALTNRHVMVDGVNKVAKFCTVLFPERSGSFTETIGNLEVSTNGYDFGRITIPNADVSLAANSAGPGKLCTERPVIGDEIIILGYPLIGSNEDITATEGIVSGFDGDYFVTSAKVERGNSGGPAILLRKNCLLGIPTFVQSGVLESLARVLDIRVLNR